MFKNKSKNLNLHLIVALGIWWSFKFFFDVWTGVDGLGFLAHKTCIETVDGRGSLDYLNLKLLCTFDVDTSDLKGAEILMKVFKNLGLVHILVASGSHLLILKKTFELIFGNSLLAKRCNFVLLFVFILISNFSGPVTRCFVQLVLSQASKRYSCHWSSVHLTALSSLVFLCFFPLAFWTLSFWLSVCASLILSLFSKDLLLMSLAFYLCLYPFIYDFAEPQLSSIVANIILTPVIAPLMIYNSILYVALPFYVPLGDQVIVLVLQILQGFVFHETLFAGTTLSIPRNYKIVYGLLFLASALKVRAMKSRFNYKAIHG